MSTIHQHEYVYSSKFDSLYCMTCNYEASDEEQEKMMEERP